MSRNKNYQGCPKPLLIFCICLVLVSAIAVAALWLLPHEKAPLPSSQPTMQDPTEPNETDPLPTETEPVPTQPPVVHVVNTATLMSTGDVLMHMPVVSTGKQADGSYDFESVFRYIAPYVTEADYAIANLETTLCGTDNGYQYSGYPCFNCPDEIATSAQTAGFDAFTTVNNHCYDTRTVGLKRTLETLRGYNMGTLGTRTSTDESRFVIQNINDINIGMIAYTYSTTDQNGRPNINGIPTSADSVGLINTFDMNNFAPFYTDLEEQLALMKEAGAEATVVFMHWGYEYQLTPSTQQTTLAQKLCDMGVDVIIGGHPHVVQPMALLNSNTDPDHKTVCLYSMGNAVSNQRLGKIQSISTAHTEDGVLFSVSFSKYSDGTVALEGVDLIPCWVNLHSGNGRSEYNILPLDDSTRDQWQTLYGLNDTSMLAAERSFTRTMQLVKAPLDECKEYLAQAKADREAAYEAAAAQAVPSN